MAATPLPASLARLEPAIEHSAAPAAVRSAFDRITGAHPQIIRWLERDDQLGDALIAVTGASRSLSRLLEQQTEAVEQLRRLDHPPLLADDIDAEALVAWKRREFLRVAARDLVGLDPLEDVGRNLSALARTVLRRACALAGADQLVVVAMGKLGGDELNYSSDIDLMFVGDGPPEAVTRQARAVVEIASRCYRVDLNLRPEGRDGPLVRSIDSYEAYWSRWAEPWEFQALLKARPVAGDTGLGARFLDTAQRWLWSHPFDTEAIRSLREMKRRAEAEMVRRGLADRELKRGSGGIRDIEFTAQLLQLVHGQLDPDLRSPTTLTTLAELGSAGYIDRHDATTLCDAYRFLRTVEHRLQLVDEQQTHTLPTEPDALDRLARVLSFRDRGDADAVSQFEQTLRGHQLAVRSIHEQVYFRPLLEAFSTSEAALSEEAALARLVAFGFTDAKRTQAAVRELTRGLNRSSRLMQQLLPLLLDWLSTAPDPDLGLLMLRNLVTGPERAGIVLDAFRDAPEAAQRLCTVLGTSRLLGDTLFHNPDLVSRLPFAEQLRTRPHDELTPRALDAIGWRDDRASQQDGLRRWVNRQTFGVAARDVFGDSPVEVVGRDLSTIADAALEAALNLLEPTIPFAVLAMGRYGGAELSYASDLDVVFVYEGGGPAAAEEANRIATRLVRFLDGATPAERIFPIDPDLRPEGKQGPLARSLEGFGRYWRRYALVWERQAMTRARPVAGDRELAHRLLDDLEPEIWGEGLTADDVREIRRLKARVEQERIPAGEDPAFHLKLGRGSLSDVEWTVQLLQLEHGVRATGTVEALEALTAAGAIDPDDAETLRAAYRFCEHTRNRWFLVNSGPADSLPTQPEPLLWLARSLGQRPTELRETYRRLTRRSRRVVERLFYGQEL